MKSKTFLNSAFFVFTGALLCWQTASATPFNGAAIPAGTYTSVEVGGGVKPTSTSDGSVNVSGVTNIGYNWGGGELLVTAGTYTTAGMSIGYGGYGNYDGRTAVLTVQDSGTVNVTSGNALLGHGGPAGGYSAIPGIVNIKTGGVLNLTTSGIQAFGWEAGSVAQLNMTGGQLNASGSSGGLRLGVGTGANVTANISGGTMTITSSDVRFGDGGATVTATQSGGLINKIGSGGNFGVAVNNAAVNYNHTGGTLNVEDTAGSMIVGWNSGDVEASGGQNYTLNGGAINVGQTSQAGLRVALGAFKTTMNVQSGSLNIGASSGLGLRIGEDFSTGGNGIMNVSGGNVTVNGGGMWVGYGASSTGVLNQTGGNVTVAPGQTLWVGNPGAPTSIGTYNLNGGILELSSLGISGASSTFNFGNGMLKNNANMATGTRMNLTGGGTWDTAGYNATLTSIAVLSGSGGLTKIGEGTLELQADNSYSGGTLVSAGTLLVTGSLGGGNTVTVGSSGTIGGDGSITGNLSFASGADFLFNPTTTLTVNGGTVTFGGFGVADLFGLTNAVADGTYTLIDGTATFNFANVSNFGLANAYSLGGGKSAYFQSGSMNLVVIPEPRAALLGSLGLLALLRRRRA